MNQMSTESWSRYQSRVKGLSSTIFLDVNEGEDGKRLVITQSYPSGQRAKITLREGEVGAFVSELLEAVSEMTGQAPPKQHPPEKVEAIRQAHPNAYTKWSKEEDVKLLVGRKSGLGIAHLARELKRQPSAVSERLRELNRS